MKHRTVTVFIMLLAMLGVMPQAFQQLTSLRDAAGARFNAGIWSAFLSLNGQKVEGSARAQTLPMVADPVSPATFELASRSTRAARVESRAARSEESHAPARPAVAGVRNFEFKFEGKELAALARLVEANDAFKVDEDGRWIVRAPEAPVKVLSPLLPASDVKYFKGQPSVHGVGEMLKGLEIHRGQQQRRLHKSNVLRSEAQRVAVAVRTEARAEAEREVESELKTEPPCPTTRGALLNCDAEDEELMN